VCRAGLTGVEPLSGSRKVSPAGTSLISGAHRSNRCWSVDSRFGVPLRSRSEGCVLVPLSSGTPVATWAWPIWVVSRGRVLEAVFILLEFPSPSRRIFIGSHSLPPLWFAVSVLHVFHTCAFCMSIMRGKDTLHSNGGCPRLDAVHAAA
jgi:hypothetical protein